MEPVKPLLIIVGTLFVALIIVLPLIRHYLRTGDWAVVVRDTSTPIEQLVRWGTVGLFAAVISWIAAVHIATPTALALFPYPPAIQAAGLCFALGFTIVIAAQAQMGLAWRIGIDDQPTQLQTSGLFSRIRHPIYSGIMLILIGLFAATPSPWTIAIGVIGALFVTLQALLEEGHLLAQHGERYLRWAHQTGRFVPRLFRREEHPTH